MILSQPALHFSKLVRLAVIILSIGAVPAAISQPTRNIEAAPDDPGSDVVELPRYVVTDERILPPPESWRYATLPGYEILSEASVRATRKFMEDFHQLQEAIGVVWPTLVNQRANVPTLIILCGRNNSISPFIAKARGAGIAITPTSLFVEDEERGAIVIDFFLQELVDVGAFPSISHPSIPESVGTSFSENPGSAHSQTATEVPNLGGHDPYEVFYRQYARFLMRRANNNKPLPPWLEEGLTRLFATLDVRKKAIEFGRVDYFGARMFGNHDPNVIITDPSERPSETWIIFVPFAELESLDKIIDYASGGSQPANWSNTSFAFVHMCLYGYNKKYQKGFLNFAKRAMSGRVTEDDFRACFGRTSKQMTTLLRSYVMMSDHGSILFKAKKGTGGLAAPPRFVVREATQAEIGRIKGEVLRLARNTDASREELIVPYLRKEHDAGLLASLGLLESLENRTARARKFLEAAVEENVVRPRAYTELARLRLEAALAAPAGSNGRLSVAQTTSLLELLFKAREQPPPMKEVYTLIGTIWLCSEATPKEAQIDVMLEGALRFPANVTIVEQAATLYALYGSKAAAATLINAGLRIAPDQGAREKFQALLARIQ